jgi:multidrug resistance efflux pump
MDRLETVSAPSAPSARPVARAEPKRRRRVPLAVWAGLVLLAGSFVLAGLAVRSHAGDSSPGEKAAPATGSEPPWVALGHVDVPDGVTPLYPVQPGQVEKILVKENQEVEKGTPLFTLDAKLARLQVDEAKVGVRAAEERLAQARDLEGQQKQKVAAQEQAVAAARADADAARSQLERARRRYKNKLIDVEDVQSAEALVRKAAASVKGEESKLDALKALHPDRAVQLAQADVDDKKIVLQKAEQVLSEHTVQAPFKGEVLRVLISPAETLGTNPRQPAIQFCPDGPRIVRAEVEQEFAGRVRTGQHALIQDEATGRGNWHGTVERLSDWFAHRRSQLIEPMQYNDVRTMECIITLDPSPERLRIGQRVRITFEEGH